MVEPPSPEGGLRGQLRRSARKVGCQPSESGELVTGMDSNTVGAATHYSASPLAVAPVRNGFIGFGE